MMPTMRPQTLVEVSSRVLSGESFARALREFLDTWRTLTSDEVRRNAVQSPPSLLAGVAPDGAMMDAYMAAVAEKLLEDAGLRAPEWVYGSERFLAYPWFAATDFPGLRPLLLMESPTAFRRRHLFVSANALDRA